MCTKNDMQLSLNGDTFRSLKEDFDSVLIRTIGNMEMKRADEATVTIKLSITLQKVSAGTLEEPKEVTKPTFKHDISSVMQVKDKKSGSISGDYELIWDKDEEKYVMRKIGAEQISVFDEEISVDDFDEEYEESRGEGYYLESGDTENIEPEITTLKWLSMSIGRHMTVKEIHEGVYAVVTDTDEIVLTSDTQNSGELYCAEEILKPHVGHSITCNGYYKDATATESESLESVCFRCVDCYELILNVEYPKPLESDEVDVEIEDEDQELMGYDAPEEDWVE